MISLVIITYIIVMAVSAYAIGYFGNKDDVPLCLAWPIFLVILPLSALGRLGNKHREIVRSAKP